MFDIHQTSAAAYTVAIDGDDFRFSGVNQACLVMVGLTAGFYPGLTPKDCFPKAVANKILERYRACRDTRTAVSYLSETAQGRRWRTTLFPTLGRDGEVSGLVGICAALSEADDRTPGLEARHEMATLAIGAIDGGFWVYEVATGTFETSVQLAEFVAGPGSGPLSLAEYASHVHAEDLAAKGLFKSSGEKSCVDYRVITFDGRTRWLRSRRRLIRDEHGAPVRVVGVVSDITKQKKQLLALESEASTDPLTSLRNRRAFERAAAQAFEGALKTGRDIGLLLIDLDGFKPINDRFGHRSGDAILCMVARRLTRHVRNPEKLARIGGDEFAVLLDDASSGQADSLAERIRRAFEKPFALDEHVVSLGVSTGIAVSTAADTTFAMLHERADRSLYAHKRLGTRLTA